MAHKTLILLVGLVFLFLIAPPVKGEMYSQNSKVKLLIYEFHPYAYPSKNNEYVCLINPSEQSISLDGFYLTDGDGVLKLSGYIGPKSKVYISQTYENFTKVMGFPPNFTYREILIQGKFSLGNKGDEIILLRNNQTIDSVCYGKCIIPDGWRGVPLEKPCAGRVYRRIWLRDTDSSYDWIKRKIYIGQSDFRFSKIEVWGEVTFFILPDCGIEEILKEIDKAREEILIETYIFTSHILAEKLAELRASGVSVKIFVEGNPAGGIPKSEKIVLSYLARNGCDVRMMYNNASAKIYDRYTYIHSKFLVIDNRTVIILTENLCKSSLPRKNCIGNRGFGLIIKNDSLARVFSKIFYDDFSPRKEDSVRFRDFVNESFKEYKEYKKIRLRKSIFEPLKLRGTFKIMPVLSPDNSYDFISKFFRYSSKIYAEQLYIRKDILSLIPQKIKGRIILDGSNSTKEDNEKILKSLRQRGLEAKIINPSSHKIWRLHAKILANESTLLVGSINMGYSSLTKNREIGIMIENKTLVNYFIKVLDYDWKDDVSPPIAKIDYYLKGSKIHLSGRHSWDDCDILHYRWYLDGKFISEDVEFNTTLRPGKHKIILVVEDHYGNTDSATLEINVPAPIDMNIIPYIAIFFLYAHLFFYKFRKREG